jgi:hypothetical protein
MPDWAEGISHMIEAGAITGTIESNNGTEALVSFPVGAQQLFERSTGSQAEFLAASPIGGTTQAKDLHMTCNLEVVQIGQEYLDWATKLRQKSYPNAGPVTHDEVGLYAVQYADGVIAADSFTDRESAQKHANDLMSNGPDAGTPLDAFAGRLADQDSWPEDQWCMAWVDNYGTEGIKDPGARFTELKAVTIVFSYPLRREARFEFDSETGFTRSEIIECIRWGYRRIYADNALNNKWGNWGHNILDLMIEDVEIDEQTGVVSIGIGS